MKQLMDFWKTNFPTKHAHYFWQRFGPINGRVLVMRSFKSLAEWENSLNEVRTKADYRKLVGQWFSCWDQSSHDEFFWDEAYVELMTKLTSSS